LQIRIEEGKASEPGAEGARRGWSVRNTSGDIAGPWGRRPWRRSSRNPTAPR